MKLNQDCTCDTRAADEAHLLCPACELEILDQPDISEMTTQVTAICPSCCHPFELTGLTLQQQADILLQEHQQLRIERPAPTPRVR